MSRLIRKAVTERVSRIPRFSDAAAGASRGKGWEAVAPEPEGRKRPAEPGPE